MFLRVILYLFVLAPNLAYAHVPRLDNFTASKKSVLEALKASPADLFNSRTEVPAFQYWNDKRNFIAGRNEPSPFVQAISEIQKKPELQNDPQIQSQLVKLFKYHPFTYIRTKALSALPLDHPQHAVYNHDDYYYSNKPKIYYGAIRKDINKSVGYCPYGKPLKACSSCNTEEKTAALTPSQNGKKMKNIRISARDVEDGMLVGYSYFLTKHGFGYYSNMRSHNDLGLHYIPNAKELPTKFIYPENIRYISHQKKNKSFWGITSWPGRCGQSTIVEITELSKGSFDVKPFIQLPGTVEGVGEGENGDLYLYFGNEDSFESQCKPTMMPIGRGRYSNNPPIIVTSDGDFRSACEADAINF